ncbi:MAG: oxidoreductase [Candidatus Thorarchaeota archaeon]
MTSKWTVEDIPDLTEKIAVVTGANSGIGYETALTLARKGAKVILACRDKSKGNNAIHLINQEISKAKIELMILDLSDLASVQHFSDEFINNYKNLDILINNAGIMRGAFKKSVDGYELQFATNHLGHFALTTYLFDYIINTSHARVVTVSSWGHHFGKIDFDNLNGEKKYNPGSAYGQSKLANLLFTYELQRRFERAGANAISVAAHPGWTKTNLPKHWMMVRLLNPIIGQKPKMGSLPVLYAATSPEVKGGDYYGPGKWKGLRGYPIKMQSSNLSYDTSLAERLWTTSEELIKNVKS